MVQNRRLYRQRRRQVTVQGPDSNLRPVKLIHSSSKCAKLAMVAGKLPTWASSEPSQSRAQSVPSVPPPDPQDNR